MDQRWDCVCGANGVAGAFCPFCGRRSPTGDLPPLPASVEAWLPPVPPRRVGLNAATATLTALLATILLVAGTVVSVRSPGYRRVRRVPTASLTEAVERGKRFVAEFRGRPFREEVDVALLDDEEFERALAGEEDDDPAEDEADFEATLYGLQLADPDDDPEAEEAALLSDTVVGFYDDETEELVVRGVDVTPYVELTIVHELAHAWQDQHFDLTALFDRTETDDEVLALRALVEGDATRVENAWRDEQPESVQDAIEEVEEGYDDEGGEEPSKATVSLALLYGFPYELGEAFVDYLEGNAAVDAAFERPPTTTAQVFDPEKYVERDEPADPPDPAAEGRVVDEGSLGQVGLVVFLANGEVTRESMLAADGWDGDEYVTWRSGSRTCTTTAVVMDDGDEREELVRALEERSLPRVTREGDRGVSFVSCAAS